MMEKKEIFRKYCGFPFFFTIISFQKLGKRRLIRIELINASLMYPS